MKVEHMKLNKSKLGFTLIEMMIVIAIIGILAAVAIPQYSDHLVKSKLSVVLRAISSVKTAVATCIQERDGLFDECNSGSNGISTSFAVREFASVTVNKAEITVALASDIGSGIKGGLIKIVPTPNKVNMVWVTSHTGITNKAAQAYLDQHN